MNNLISMLRELDLEKNSKEQIRYVLNFIADELEKCCIGVDLYTYIEDEKEYDSVKENKNGVLDYLESLTDEDISQIEQNIVNDDELYEKINELTDYHLYHYKQWYKEEENAD